MTDWFETLFGFRETSPEEVRENIELHDRKLYSRINGNSYGIGQLTTPCLEELRSSAAESSESLQGKLKVQNVIGDIFAWLQEVDEVHYNEMLEVVQ